MSKSVKRKQPTASQRGRTAGINLMLNTPGSEDYNEAEVLQQAELAASFEPEEDQDAFKVAFLAGVSEVAPLEGRK
jgi:hypothetical protein